MPLHTVETIIYEYGIKVRRMRVKDGWLYFTITNQGVSTTFVEDK